MDHLRWPDSHPLPRPVVPYLLAGAEDAIFNSKHDLHLWPEKLGWDLYEVVSIQESAKRCQAWLYFGFLRVLAESAREVFKINDYVSESDGDRLLNSSKVKDLMQCLSKKLFTTPLWNGPTFTRDPLPAAYDIYHLLRQTLLKACPWIMCVVRQHKEATRDKDLWDNPLYNVFFSTFILFEEFIDIFADHDMFYLFADYPKKLMSLFASETRGVIAAWKRIGRCPTVLRRIQPSPLNAFRLLAMPTTGRFEHHSCSGRNCTAFNIDPCNYQTQHTKNCWGESCNLRCIDPGNWMIWYDKMPFH